MWFGQTGLNVNRFETGLSASVNGALEKDCTLRLYQYRPKDVEGPSIGAYHWTVANVLQAALWGEHV